MNAINTQASLPSFYVAFSVHGTDRWISAYTPPDLVKEALSHYGNDFGPKEGPSFQVGDSHFQVGQTLRIVAAIENGLPCTDVFTIGASRRSGYDPSQGIKLLASGLLTPSKKPTTDPKKVLAYFTQLAKAGWMIKDYEDFLECFAWSLNNDNVDEFMRAAGILLSGTGSGQDTPVPEAEPLPEKIVSKPEKVTEATLNAALVKHHLTLRNKMTWLGSTVPRLHVSWEFVPADSSLGQKG